MQHGVIINKLEWLFYRNSYMRLFITSAVPEHSYIINEFDYPHERVKMCGLARFDNLHDAQIDKDMILVMPTWRNWLGRESHDNKGLDFVETEYYKKWNEFLNSKELDEILATYGKKIIFYPHRNMQKFLQYFKTESQNIEIADWKNYDIQDVLKRAALMITDYSSVFFDFAYMRKPVIFYQFDEEEFRKRQYEKGYFDYRNTELGEWAGNLTDVLVLLKESLSNGLNQIDEDVIRKFFPLWDTKNSQRIYESILII